ncbi:PRC-barrel domain-containing protein [Streptacidiphilus melanogenes]|uniref:PRC-barrel domain-containing protein n=1 Tax=Streptacidiphilus melanogenes TaxID=411235 RepID=UPI0005AB191F|nr:PRC-barrel domain-containing protein [Streptacidiphilus melanogenes]
MIEVGDIREWRTHDVVDADGNKIGTLEAIYVDTTTDEPAMATVQIGMPTQHRLVFVPLNDATVGPGYLKVAYDRALVRDCPALGMDDILPAEDEEAVFQHYSLTYQKGAGGERQLARR